MAHDTTPPRNRMILIFTLVSPALLILLVPLFHTYFTQMTEGEAVTRVAESPPGIRDEIFATEREHLDTGPMPIERAMRDIAARGRDASPVIAPTPSDDMGAVSGWGPLADEAAVAAAEAAHAAAHPPPPPPPPAPSAAPVIGGASPPTPAAPTPAVPIPAAPTPAAPTPSP